MILYNDWYVFHENRWIGYKEKLGQWGHADTAPVSFNASCGWSLQRTQRYKMTSLLPKGREIQGRGCAEVRAAWQRAQSYELSYARQARESDIPGMLGSPSSLAIGDTTRRCLSRIMHGNYSRKTILSEDVQSRDWHHEKLTAAAAASSWNRINRS